MTSSSLTVSELNRYIYEQLTTTVPPLSVVGELSNVTRASSGHWYFTLKDQNAQVRCTLWRTKADALSIKLADGLKIEVYGQVTLYEPRGDYQFNVESVRQAGTGNLWIAFQALKERMAQADLFNAEHKRVIPIAPHAIGIITSPNAAALQDILKQLATRAPGLGIIIYPSQVQGDKAASTLIEAIKQANDRNEVDLLIICRGGGSIEDLWCFNDEALALAISRSTLPVISAVGHETDFTICDFVADKRCATPTAAAEYVSAHAQQQSRRLASLHQQTKKNCHHLMALLMQRLDQLSARLRHPSLQCQQQQARINALLNRLSSPATMAYLTKQHRIAHLNQALLQLKPNLEPAKTHISHLLEKQKQLVQEHHRALQQRLQQANQQLAALSPRAVLARGYAIVMNEDNKPLETSSQLTIGSAVHITFAKGSAQARITELDE